MDFLKLTNDNFSELKIQIKKDVIFKELDDEMIIMDMNSGRYFGLNETGAKIWSLLNDHHNIGTIINLLHDEYEISKEKCKKEVIAFIQDILDKGLINVEKTV